MGLYRIPIQPEKIEAIPHLMRSIGFPVVRAENQDNGISYFCANPKRLNKYWTFRITREENNSSPIFTCGLSQLSKQIVGALSLEDFFDKEHSGRGAIGDHRAKYPGHRSARIG